MKLLNGYLRMQSVTGTYPLDISQAVYEANIGQFNRVYPINGGELLADGTWQLALSQFNTPWKTGLKDQAHAAGQVFMPISVQNSQAAILAVLNSSTLREQAIANLVSTARSGRADSPWDGVMVDIELVPPAYATVLNQWYRDLADAFHANGLLLGLSGRGRVADTGGDFQDAYTNDWAVIGQIADVVDYFCYDFTQPAPRSNAPYWWVAQAIEYALGKGVPASRLNLGVPAFSRVYPSSSDLETYNNITWAQAQALGGITLGWIESNGNGVVRELYGSNGTSHAWAANVNATRYSMDLVDQYGLDGFTFFTVGMEDPSVYPAIASWKAGELKESWRGYQRVTCSNVSCNDANMASALRGLVDSNGHTRPHLRGHVRRVGTRDYVVEYGDGAPLLMSQIANRLGAFGVGINESALLASLTVTTYAGSDWEARRIACKTALGI